MFTPDEIRNTVFQKAAMGGYKVSDVEMFLEEVAQFIEQLNLKISSLEGNSGTKVAETVQAVVPNKDVKATDFDIQSVLIKAQQFAENIEIEARQTAEKIRIEAEENANKIVVAAEERASAAIEKANNLLDDAERHDATIKENADEEAKKIINEAKEMAERLLIAAQERVKMQELIFEKLKSESQKYKRNIVEICKSQVGILASIPDEAPAVDPEEVVIKRAEPEAKAEPEVKEELEAKAEPEVKEPEVEAEMSEISGEDEEGFDIVTDEVSGEVTGDFDEIERTEE